MIGWRAVFPQDGVTIEVDHLRRERHELLGELTVRCTIAGALTINGFLSTGDFNFSSLRARQERAKHLTIRSRTNGTPDWYGLLEECCQGVFEKERQGDPAIDIWDIPPPEKADDFAIHGLAFPRRHPSILFGDGGSAKSYIALYMAGRLALQGVPVAFFDWELSGQEHRERMQRLFQFERPKLTYCRCETSISHEIDRLERVVRERNIQYVFLDSIAFACDGKPEDAESASRYFRALRQLGIGSLNIAHINRSESAEFKPFGSSFWHNGARSTWFVEGKPAGKGALNLGFQHRKSNLGRLREAVILNMSFTSNQTIIQQGQLSDDPELAQKMPIRQRIQSLLEKGAMTYVEIAEALEVKVDSVIKAVNRRNEFSIIQGGKGEQNRVQLA